MKRLSRFIRKILVSKIDIFGPLRKNSEALTRMALKKPSSVEECVYFTNRTIGNGRAMAWVFRKECPKCRKGVMGKPQKKGGKLDKKADHYLCYQCGYQESNEQVENSLVINVEYKCPYCSFESETTLEYKRKVDELWAEKERSEHSQINSS